MNRFRSWLVSGLVIGAVAALSLSSLVEGQMRHGEKGEAHSGPPAPIRITMDQLHAQGGVPKGWKFLMPPGDVAEGRQVFVTMECFACHEVKGEDFPHDTKTPRDAGPELTGMGSHHPPEYFAESILNPNRVILLGPGYTGPDRLSKMPSYADSMTLKQLVDVVAYLKSLTGGESKHGSHHMDDSKSTHEMKMK
jgi:mono/diheme cytochrome c family protein